jgi:hypothetical protein
MGYDLHITRQEFWADEENINQISFEEWLNYVESDSELELTNGYETRIPRIENKFHNIPGFCNWSGHSIMKGNSMPWFDYRDGCISTKNPDEEIIKKMLRIANVLSAKVQGDEGEFYDESSFVTKPGPTVQTSKVKRPWWKFW